MNQKVVFDASNNCVAVRPYSSTDVIKDLVLKCFGLKLDPNSKLQELISYTDRNYIVEGVLNKRGNVLDEQYKHTNKFVLKLFNSAETSKKEWYENINTIINYCDQECGNFKLACPVYAADNSTMTVLYDIPLQKDVDVIGCSSLNEIAAKTEILNTQNGIYYVKHMARLSLYIPGVVIDTKTMSNKQAFNYGKSIAILDSALKNIAAPEIDMQENFIWNLIKVRSNNFHELYVNHLADTDNKHIIEDILQIFGNEVLPKLNMLPKQWIHGDLNEQNILQDELDNCDEITGILDFDDMVYSSKVVDIATGLMYVTATSTLERSMDLAKQLFQGYSSVILLNDVELECIFNVMLVRYVLSCCIGTYQYKYVDPGNDYLLITCKTGWERMKFLFSQGEEEFLRKVQEHL